MAHELAHSWSGNLVTNATWRDFWLNEGFTTYFELRIMEALYGAERAVMLEALERAGMMKELAELGRDNPATQLHLPDTGDDPDASMSDLAYSKGSAFLRMLEQQVGRAALDAYLRGYFDRRAFTSLTTPEFAADLERHLLSRRRGARQGAADRRVARSSRPAGQRHRSQVGAAGARGSERRAVCEGRSRRGVEGVRRGPRRSGWRSSTPSRGRCPWSGWTALDRAFHLGDRANSEVRFSWLRLAIAHHYGPAVPALERFLSAQGRRKFVQPLFEALDSDDWGRPIAKRIYGQVREGYHPVTVAALDRLLGQ